METSKKFLDENGLTTLWNQIENNFISTDDIEAIISAIDAIKADKESPEFTGVPTAPTANINTNTKQIATTEFVNNTISELTTRLNAVVSDANQLKQNLVRLENLLIQIQDKLNQGTVVDNITVNEINNMIVSYFENKTVTEVEG